ncbi:MAG TPA: bifunctional DNA primase/polymerase [Micromonosporaceae bacterium]
MARVTRLFEDGCPARARIRRLRLRHAALTYARHGWHVLAGSRLCGDRFKCGPGCCTFACHPVAQKWDAASTIDPDTITINWKRSPYSVLLPTGNAFDVVEVPSPIGALADDQLRGPVVVTPTGQWMYLVQPGQPLHPALARHRDVVLHQLGSWIPAPPMRSPEGPVRWVISPTEANWQLPDAREVQNALVATLPWLGYPAVPEDLRAIA